MEPVTIFTFIQETMETLAVYNAQLYARLDESINFVLTPLKNQQKATRCRCQNVFLIYQTSSSLQGCKLNTIQ